MVGLYSQRLAAAFSHPTGFGDARIGVATAGAAAVVAQQVLGKALRDTLFLGAFGVERLPYAMIAAALLSGVLVLALSRAGAARSARRVARATLLLSAAVFLVAWGISGLSARAAAAVTYLQAGALSAASVSVFWSLVTETFDPYTARVSVPRVMAGATLGGVLGGVATWRAAAWIEPTDLLLLGAALNMVALAAVSRLPGGGTPRAPTPNGGEAEWRTFIRDLPYLRALAFLVVAAAVTQAILDYLLASTAVESFGSGPPLLSFFALFQTTVGVLSFLLQVGISRSALERFGVGPVLAVSPSVLLTGLLATLFAPPLAATVLLRGADGVLGASVYRSAYEVLFAPLDARKKRASKPLIDVGFDRLGTLLGSGLVALVLAVTATTAVHAVLLGAVAALALWRLLLSGGLQAGYRRSLADNLRQGRVASSAVLDRATVGSLETAGGLDRRALLEEVERLRAAQSRSLVPHGSARLSIAAFDVPVCPEPDDEEPAVGRSDDALIDALRDLRSGDEERARRVLRLRRTEPLLARQVIDLLGDDRVARDAADWLTAQVPSPTGLLADALLSDDLAETARRRVARLLGKSEDPRAADALLAALPRVPTGVRLGLAHALVRTASRRQLPREPILAAVTRAAEEPPSGDGPSQLDVVFTLLAAAYPREPVQPALRALDRGGNARGTALEWLDVLLPTDVKRALWPRIVRSGERIPSTFRDADALRTALRATQLTPEPAQKSDDDGEDA
jgi:ATP:ADP antiporter, AAA family